MVADPFFRKKLSRVIGYGPIFDVDTAWDDPNAPQLGHVLFFNAPNDEFATKFVESDPFNLHGAYKSIFTARWGTVWCADKSMFNGRINIR